VRKRTLGWHDCGSNTSCGINDQSRQTAATIWIALRCRRADNFDMKTTSRRSCLCGWLLKGTCAMVGLSLCASVWADTDGKNVVAMAKPQPAKSKKVYLIMSSTSAIPQPIERFGIIPTTASPLEIIGNPPDRK
jgi:hypothetical protein